MRITTLLGACLLAFPLVAIGADCEAPERFRDIPDGTTASKEAMLEGQANVKDYMERAQAYVDCVDAAEEKAMERMARMDESQRKQKLGELRRARKERNQVVEQMQAVADEFNREIDAYQTQQADGS